MKIKNAEGKEIEVKLRTPTGAEVKEGFAMFSKIENDNATTKELVDYIDYLDKFASKISDKSIEELDALSLDEKNKILEYCHKWIRSRVDFMKPSSKQAA